MLPDAAVLSRSAARAQAIAEAWRDDAGVRRIAAAFADLPADACDRVADAAAALLADGRWIAPLLAPLIAALADDPWFEPPFRVTRDPLRTTVQLLELAHGTLTATVFAGAALAASSPATLAASGRLSVARYHRAGGARLLRWHAGAATGDMVAATAAPLRALPPLALTDGDVLRIDGRDVAQLIEGAGHDVVVLTFATRGGGLMREYDRRDGRLLRIATNDDGDSRTSLLLTLLRLGGRADAGHCFDAASRSPAFHLRWTAMREWLALDAAAALPRLRAMSTDDPHPEVRAAARATLPLVERRLCRA